MRQVATEILSQLNYAHNRHAKRLQVFNGILYYSSGASHTILGHTSRMGITISHTNILRILEELSKDEAKKLEAVGRDPGRGLDLVFDNVQTYAKQWEMRIGRESAMKVGMAATAVEIDSFDPEAVNLGKRRQLIHEGKGKKMTLTTERVLKLLNADHARTVGALHWLQILATYVPQLEEHKGYIREMFRTRPSMNIRLDKDGVRRTIIHPLATSAKGETAVKELKEGLVDFLEQMGQTPDNYQQRIVLAGGDGLTFEQMGNLKNMAQTQDGPFKSFEILQPYLQLWHTEWTDLCRLLWLISERTGQQIRQRSGTARPRLASSDQRTWRRLITIPDHTTSTGCLTYGFWTVGGENVLLVSQILLLTPLSACSSRPRTCGRTSKISIARTESLAPKNFLTWR